MPRVARTRPEPRASHGVEYAAKAVELEKVKQRLREVAKSTRLSYSQVKGLYKHFKQDVEPTKSCNIGDESFRAEHGSHQADALRQGVLDDLGKAAADFEAAFFAPEHPFPFDGTAEKVRTFFGGAGREESSKMADQNWD